MKEKDKERIDTEWYTQYNLNSKQLTQLIVEKFERALYYRSSDNKREALLVESR